MFSLQNNNHMDIADVHRVINNDQDSTIHVLSWNINGLGSKMTDLDLVAFIRNYDMIFFYRNNESERFILAIPGCKFHHVSRKHKHKNGCRASGGIGILISNKYADLSRIDHTLDHTYGYLVWLTGQLQTVVKKTLKLVGHIYHQKTDMSV